MLRRGDCGRRLGKKIDPAGDQRHLRARLRKRGGGGEADARRGPSHQRAFCRQGERTGSGG